MKKNPAAVALGKRRAKKLGKKLMSEIGKLGGRPKVAERCACGKYTARRAISRRHKCEESI